MSEFEPDFTKVPRQSVAWNTITSPKIKEILYGGAKGGGKSVFGCFWSYIQAYEIAQKYFPEIPEHPLPVGFMGRKVAKDFKDTTLETWKRFVPAERYVIKGKPAEIIIGDRVKILTGGLDRQEDVNKFNSAELAFFFLDQAEEISKDDVSVLRASLRLTINDKKLPYKGLFTANPRQCWLKDDFILNPAPNRKFVQALPGDNPLLPDNYVETLKDSFNHRPELLQAYLYGDWDAFEDSDQIIKGIWLDAAQARGAYWPFIKRYLVCDPARFGDDETVIYAMENTEIEEKVIMPHSKTTEISGKMAAMAYERYDCQCVVESQGADLGAGVIDELTDAGKDVITFNPAERKEIADPKHIYNRRCEAWNFAAKALCSGIIDKESNCPVVLNNIYDTLKGQLCTPHYKFRGKYFIVEKKEDIKKRLGRSPDHADCYVIALWAWPLIDTEDERKMLQNADKDEYRRKDEPRSAMTT